MSEKPNKPRRCVEELTDNLRFNSYGVTTTEEMYALSLGQMREVFGGIVGERWWRLIRGQQVVLPPVKRWQIGHSSVLAPEFRTQAGSWSVACRLLEKAATRLRAEGYHTGRLCVAVSNLGGEGWTLRQKFSPCNRTPFLMEQLWNLWAQAEKSGRRVAKPGHVSVSLQDILPDSHVIPSLFEDEKVVRLDKATDGINDRWGRGTVTVASALASKTALDHCRRVVQRRVYGPDPLGLVPQLQRRPPAQQHRPRPVLRVAARGNVDQSRHDAFALVPAPLPVGRD